MKETMKAETGKKRIMAVCALLVLQGVCLCGFAPSDRGQGGEYQYETSEDYLLKITGEDADYTFYDFPEGVETSGGTGDISFQGTVLQRQNLQLSGGRGRRGL